MLPLEMAIAFSLIGLGAVIAAGVGLTLPRGERATALLALAVGGGVGLISLAVGSSFISEDHSEAIFLVASILGFVATTVTAASILNASRREAPGSVSARDA